MILTINFHELKICKLLEYWSNSHRFSKLVIKFKMHAKKIKRTINNAKKQQIIINMQNHPNSKTANLKKHIFLCNLNSKRLPKPLTRTK
jgi:hypothetical protein